ncbi:MAG: hypothetical protein M1133_11995 [Armatimonadetes bacterium]|nr:hypothetical protein [Armatimonadota bacterium]MCL5104819.1 hypothetical protein [Armatimonadota bacterium]
MNNTECSGERRSGLNVWPPIAFAVAVGVHLLVKYKAGLPAENCALQVWHPPANWFASYVRSQDYFLSFSYGLAAGFAAYAFSFWAANRRAAAVGGIGGVSLAGIIWGAGCFLTGCCGSPMLGVYASILGTRATWFGKPLTAVFTLLSVILGYVMIRRKICTGCCRG